MHRILDDKLTDPIQKLHIILDDICYNVHLHAHLISHMFSPGLNVRHVEKYMIYYIKELLRVKNGEENHEWQIVFSRSEESDSSLERRYRRIQSRYQDVKEEDGRREERGQKGIQGRKKKAEGSKA